MITLKKLLESVLQEEESEAAQQAHALGLVSGGWGTWKDKTGKTVAKTIRGQLVKVEDVDEFDAEDELNDFAQQMREKHGLKSFELMFNQLGDIRLDSIIVDKTKQRQGSGTAAMEDLVRYADAHGKRLLLTPAQKNSEHGTTSSARLKKFYRRFGFVPNSGRNKDFRVSDSMVRNPRSQQQ